MLKSNGKQKMLIVWSVVTVINQLMKNEWELTTGIKRLKGKKEQGDKNQYGFIKGNNVHSSVPRAQGFILPACLSCSK